MTWAQLAEVGDPRTFNLVTVPEFLADGYAWADLDGNVTVRRLADHAELYRLRGEGPLDWYDTLRFSPDGRFLVQQCRTPAGWHGRLWKLDGAEPSVVLPGADGGWDFSPDSRQVAIPFTKDREIRIYDTETGRELRRLPNDTFFVLGDNFENSEDSRSYGPIPRQSIIGKQW